ncbi:plasmid partitioning protein RepB (plasmid) [Aminobacter sp. NyZ550]|uniref:plasmid partitioning protein RepB n=1 Tax=unclassified Aminobacter TaxID=2644704 RepID=UPI0021D5C64F|nr:MULTISPECIES: plasmid partitioning protein RepB [unclassified Aminobacter]WAX98460.1 plasmid partitioning protein RepB [Aminobacter sp. NyZ550]BBD40548.1 plasmid partitioning protein RepB [Aminobacter sp. SS-2016]
MALNRKDQLKALFGTVEPAPVAATPTEKAPETKTAEPDAARQRSASGAVKAMGLSLGGLSKEIEEARRLKESLDAAERVSQVDASLIEASFVADRLDHGAQDPDFDALVSSIETSGQQVPVLLRPHPDKPGRYQTAYGHRRVRAAGKLGVPVLAIVRPLSDVELVLAQGKENSERRDLSFIERALFAHELIARGFERAVVQDALSLHKAEMTRFLQVADAVPEQVVRAIGAAPKIGRPRWMALAELLKSEAARVKADDEVTSQRFLAATSDERFNMLFMHLQRKTQPIAGAVREIRDGKGRAVASLTVSKGKARIDFLEKAADGLADFLDEELPKLLERFEQERGRSAGQG